jgi:hypothetical protein
MPAAEVDSAFTRNAGWIGGLLVVLAVGAAGALLWFHYHP